MELTVNKKEFINAVSFIKAINSFKRLHLYLKWDKDKLYVGSPFYLIQYEMPAYCTESGYAFIMDVDIFKHKGVFNDIITIKATDTTIIIGGIEYDTTLDAKSIADIENMMQGIHGTDFATIKIPKNKAKEAFRIGSITEQVLNGKEFFSCLDKGNLVSTNGRILSVVPLGIDTSYKGTEYRPTTISKAVLSVLKYGKDDYLTLTYGNREKVDSVGNRQMEKVIYVDYGVIKGFLPCPQIQYPNWEKLLPDYSATAILNRDTILSELQSVKPVLEGRNIYTYKGYMCYENNKDELVYKGKIPILPKDMPEISMQWDYLYNVLTSFSTSSIIVRWNTSSSYINLKDGRKGLPAKAMLFTDGDTKESKIIIVMSMQFNEDDIVD